jgi:hypothetical protein
VRGSGGVKVVKFILQDIYFKKQWEGLTQAEDTVTTWDTGIHLDLLTFIGSKSVKFPKDFVSCVFNFSEIVEREHCRMSILLC